MALNLKHVEYPTTIGKGEQNLLMLRFAEIKAVGATPITFWDLHDDSLQTSPRFVVKRDDRLTTKVRNVQLPCHQISPTMSFTDSTLGSEAQERRVMTASRMARSILFQSTFPVFALRSCRSTSMYL